MTTLSPPTAAPPVTAVPTPAAAGPPEPDSPRTPAPAAPSRFDNGAEWHRALGGVPLERIIFNPWPGTATEADLLRYVEARDRLCELIDGTLVEKPMGYWEGVIAVTIASLVRAFAAPRKLGLVSGPDSTLRMANGRVRLPDVSFVSAARVPTSRAPVPSLSPDLAIEVLSESNTTAEIDQKLREYFASGTRLAWVIDPADRTAAVYRGPGEPAVVLTEAGTLDGGDVLPGFAMSVADAFEGVPPLTD